MCLSIDYFGRTGNNVFQWVFGRLFAEKHGLGIITRPPDFFYGIRPAPSGSVNLNVGETVIDDTINRRHDTNYLDGDYKNSNVRIHGYFQDVKYYQDWERIKGFFNLPSIKKNVDDIVIHLRLTDYYWERVRSVIDPEWYIRILSREKYSHCYIVVEPHPTNEKYLKNLQSRIKRSTVVSQSAAEDFDFIRQFDRIVCSNSTFAWWAAYLSEASKIWTFKKWIQNDVIPLAEMPGAKVVDGRFINDVKLSKMDWTDYFNK